MNEQTATTIDRAKLRNLVEAFSGRWHIEKRQNAPHSRTFCGLSIVARNCYRSSLNGHGAICSDCVEAASAAK